MPGPAASIGTPIDHSKWLKLEPAAALAQHFTVIGDDEDIGIVGSADTLDHIEQASDQMVKV